MLFYVSLRMRNLLRINSRDYRNFLRFVIFILLLKVRQALMMLRVFTDDLEDWFSSLTPKVVVPRRFVSKFHSSELALGFSSIFDYPRVTALFSKSYELPDELLRGSVSFDSARIVDSRRVSSTLNRIKKFKRVLDDFKFTSFNRIFDQVEQFAKESKS